MGHTSTDQLRDYDNDTYTRQFTGALDPADDLFAPLRHKGSRGSSPVVRKAVYIDMLNCIRETAGDRCVWPAQKKAAFRIGITERSYRDAVHDLVADGYLYESTTDRMAAGAKTVCYHVVDVIGEDAALRAWAVQRVEALAASTREPDGIPVDDEHTDAARATVKAEIAAARERFQAMHPDHYPTRGRLLAILTGRPVHVPRTRVEALAAHRSAKSAVVKSLTERGVADAAAVVEDELAARRAAGAPVSARAIRQGLDAGEFEHLAPDWTGEVDGFAEGA